LLEQVAQRRFARRIADHRQRRSVRDAQRGKLGNAVLRRQGGDAETTRVARDHIKRAGPDGTGRPQDGDALRSLPRFFR
jgi:hypothetical protein